MKSKGFTLMELMIAVAVVGILAAIAYPSYVEQLRKTRRSDAKAALLNGAQVLERCYTEYNTYNNIACPAVKNTDNTKLDPAFTTTEGGYYTLSAASLTATGFSLQATPAGGVQANDKCGYLRYSNIGQKLVGGDADGDGVVGDNDDIQMCW